MDYFFEQFKRSRVKIHPMPEKITLYQKPTCTTCRQVHAALKESGVDFKDVNYFTDRLSKDTLKRLLKAMGLPASELIRRNEEIYKTLKLSEKSLTEGQWVDLMLRYPDLIQRPIVERGAKAILARPVERLKDIIF